MQEAQSPFEENQKVLDWSDSYIKATRSSASVVMLKIKPRQPLVGDWLKTGDLGFIFAARGIGKSWLAMYLAKGLATKTDVGPWKTHAQARVLYLDGEMAIEDLQARDRVLGTPNEELSYINHEILFQETGKIMNMANLDFQAGILHFCLHENFNVLVADNLSTLSSGIDENKALDWELIQPWLLNLRRHHITVIIVHHAGRNNQMRGSSKREDPAFWIIRLDEDNWTDDHDRSGACFVSRFTKWRNAAVLPHAYRWQFKPARDSEVDILFKEASPMFVFLQWVESGLDTCSDIATEMDVSKGFISRLAKHAESLGRIEIHGRKYSIQD